MDRKRIFALFLAFATVLLAASGTPSVQVVDHAELIGQTPEEAEAKSRGCLRCHQGIGNMHESAAVRLGCTDCHGGDAGAPEKSVAHVSPRFPERWPGSANPQRSYTLLNVESPEFVRFVNPGDLRVAAETCGGCHPAQTNAVSKSTMTTSAVFWAAAAYANGILGNKWAVLGESYSRDGKPQMIKPVPPPGSEEQIRKGALEVLYPLPRWEAMQPGEYFRAFERGGSLQPSFFPDIGNPNSAEEAGRPDIRFSNRGRGTGLRVSPGLINLHKTRLNDPHLSFLGTNDHPGDYRSSGCSGCHVVYANDRDTAHSGPYAEFGNSGEYFGEDRSVPRNESGHPIQHRLTRSVPASQCMSCHMHQPNSFVNTFFGYTMWDYESDAAQLFPKEQRDPTAAEARASLDHNPEGAAVRGLWTDPGFLRNVADLNPKLQHTQLADYHGHGWIFQAVFKRDRKGRLLDREDRVVPFDDPERFRKAVHLKDIHLEKGMHCVDCHFSRDSHGDGLLHGEYGDSIEIECVDCHGSIRAYSSLRTSGPAAPPGGTDLRAGTTPFAQRRFVWREGKLYQRSMLTRDLEWEVVQVKDTITPGHARYNERSRFAKTVQRNGQAWGSALAASLAHRDEEMTCTTCHSSWMTSCFGCHLPQEANQKSPMLHYEGKETRNYASYNPQVVRSDVYMLGINGTRSGNKVSPVRSSSAVMLSSTNLNRQRVYIQQPTISAPGFSGQAFNPHTPHTVRSRETKGCADCHVARDNDNNAWMAQLLTLGTGFVNFVGRHVWLGLEDHGLEAVVVTEWDEPQAVIGSSLHQIVYPDSHHEHQRRGQRLRVARHHHGDVSSLQLRGEYLFTAGPKGLVVYDVANIDNKDFSERIVSAPVSPLGQRTYVRTRHGTAVALPTTMPMAPLRKRLPENQEQPIHPIYQYAFVSDLQEGLILVNVNTLTDGDPENNFLTRALTFNPDGLLKGARAVTVAGNHVLVGCDRGLVILDFSEPLSPRVLSVVDGVDAPTSIAVQFRYVFLTDGEGLRVIDWTDPARPRQAARVAIPEARSVYVARTYAYVAAGQQGLVIVDVERPEHSFVDQVFDADGDLNDCHDVKVASTNASLFAYVADGRNGLAVLQLTSPDATPGYAGFSPRPLPRLIARRPTRGAAVALSRGLDRDRAVDESGNQVAVFNRIGARPFTLLEMQKLYLGTDGLYTVTTKPTTMPVEP